MKQDLESLKRLIAVHNQLVDWSTRRVTELGASIAACDRSRNEEMVKVDEFAGTGLFNASLSSRRLRELSQRREALVAETMIAQRELARLQAVIERLREKDVVARIEAEQSDQAAALEDWAGRSAAS